MNKKGERKEIPYRTGLKKLCKFQRDRISRKSLIEFIEKSYMNTKGTGLPIKAKKEYIL